MNARKRVEPRAVGQIEIEEHDAPVAIELTFIGQGKFPKTRGTLSLTSPKFDLPMKNARSEPFAMPIEIAATVLVSLHDTATVAA